MKARTKLAVFLTVILAAYFCTGGLALASGDDTPFEIDGGEAVLIAEEVMSHSPLWCRGSDMLVYWKKYDGLYYYEPKTSKTTRVADDYNVPIACTPDGEWLLYLERDSYRYYKDDPNNPLIADVWRYEFSTGRKHKFLAMSERRDFVFDKKDVSSPGKIKLYVGGPIEEIEMPDPKWDVERHDRDIADAWFRDGSVFFNMQYGNQKQDVLVAEVYRPERKTIEVEHQFWDIGILGVDKRNRLYLYVEEDGKDDRVERCEVDFEGKKLSCGTVLDGMRGLDGFGLFRDEETVVFTSYIYNCVMVIRIGDEVEKASCVTQRTSKNYISYYSTLSMDDKRLAFGIAPAREQEDDRYFDLYIINLQD
jgi:hypothetical protein